VKLQDEREVKSLSDRIEEVRWDPYGEEGIPTLVDSLELPVRTRMNYERGVIMPSRASGMGARPVTWRGRGSIPRGSRKPTLDRWR